MQDIRAMILQRMKARELSARALAMEAGVKERTVQRFVNGASIHHRELERLFNALKMRII